MAKLTQTKIKKTTKASPVFDIGVSELLLVAMLTLVVAGPQRLPTIARTIGIWRRRLSEIMSQANWELERTITAEDVEKMQVTQKQDSEGLAKDDDKP